MSQSGSVVHGPRNLRRRSFEFRTEREWAGRPFVHVSFGGRGDDGRCRLGRARGLIAVGDSAVGLIAIGGIAVGLLSFGGLAIGLVALGGIALGLNATGAIAIGLTAVGAIAVGVTTHGPVTVGGALSAWSTSKRPSPPASAGKSGKSGRGTPARTGGRARGERLTARSSRDVPGTTESAQPDPGV